MSALLSLAQVSLNLGAHPLFVDLTLHLNLGDRIGLVGHNGSGKSSLLKLLQGELAPDDGERRSQRNVVVAMVDQFVPEALLARTLREAAELALPEARRELEAYRAEAELHKLGFEISQFDIPVAELSGGQQNLLLMARAILVDPDVLLLDEPGNHMDILSLTRLRRWLTQLHQPWVLVSHDRHLLNAVCRQTWILRDRTVYRFELPFDRARAALAHADEQAAARRAEEEKEVARIEASAKRLAHWGHTFDNEDLSRKAKTMAKRADRLRADYTFVSQGSGLSLALPETGLTARQVLVLEDLTVTVPATGRTLVQCEFLNLRPGDRVALLGINGVGKSTTLQRIIDALNHEDGPIRWNPRVTLGYYEQQLAELNRGLGRFDWLREQVAGPDDAIRQTLLHSGVPYERFDEPVEQLSGGEKARLVFALFRLQRPNVLVLDEPTNHIDLDGRAELIEALVNSDITVLMTSHDQHFMEAVATRWWWINAGRLQEVTGPEGFYQSLESTVSAQPGETQSIRESIDALDDETLLARIDELETRLAQDRARKPKHQKPDRQARWEQELSALWQRL
ncbi:ABC-F family ATP-binding cassette domain-containing protein [Natronospirillum operosum]|uniref:ABC-F family ATP-binding cassette domain-containing protein n=1 Tax=Natronospirillum operosum TaxID=2759953 RepID=A0A4Z0W9J0_9GAMM|nr:ABC-F family ATP-binding cassette domain-containing protein [Natronospirillum operosum]TGG91993.1 ABC-F family ATP-binding cassette domain-containing protein [Natronospirillum operosum]